MILRSVVFSAIIENFISSSEGNKYKCVQPNNKQSDRTQNIHSKKVCLHQTLSSELGDICGGKDRNNVKVKEVSLLAKKNLNEMIPNDIMLYSNMDN